MDACVIDLAPGELLEGLSLVEVLDPTMLARIFRLRVEAWRARDPTFPDIGSWSDHFDDVARHWAVLDTEGRPLAAARMSVHGKLADVPDAELYAGVVGELEGPIASINRLVVAPAGRGLGLARNLDLIRVDAARSSGCRAIIGASRAGDKRIAAARALGFVVTGQARPYADGPLRSARGLDVILLRALDQPQP